MNKEETACLTGHRPAKLPWFYNETKENCIRFKEDLKTIFSGAIQYGLKNYLVGMAEGFDMIGAETLIELRKHNPSRVHGSYHQFRTGKCLYRGAGCRCPQAGWR